MKTTVKLGEWPVECDFDWQKVATVKTLWAEYRQPQHNRERGINVDLIGGGSNNHINAPIRPTEFNSIFGGAFNVINDGAVAAFIGGGCTNSVLESWSTIAGGASNQIDAGSNCGFIGGGEQNHISGTSVFTGTTILGGFQNQTKARLSVIAGGSNNHIYDVYNSAIGAGHNNCICFGSDMGAIGGGQGNSIFNNSPYSFIGGGESNSISTAGASLGSSQGNVIGGGFSNRITRGCHNVILGGAGNVLTGNCNAILGGTGNNNGGYNNVGIYGQGITAITNDAFHAKNYVVQNMPIGFTPLPFCQLYAYTSVMSGLNEVFIV